MECERVANTVCSLHQMGFEPMRLSPEDLKSSLLDLAPALMLWHPRWVSNPHQRFRRSLYYPLYYGGCSIWGSNPGSLVHKANALTNYANRARFGALTLPTLPRTFFFNTSNVI